MGIMAMENNTKDKKIGLNEMPKHKTDEFDIITENLNYHDLSKLGQASETLFTKIQDSPNSKIINQRQSIVKAYEKDIGEFMKNQPGHTWKCVKSGDGYYPDFKCSTVFQNTITFSGDPGFQIAAINYGGLSIIGPITGQGQINQITEAMCIREFNGTSLIKSSESEEEKLATAIVDYWTTNPNTEYTFTFRNQGIKLDTAALFNQQKELGLSIIEEIYSRGKHIVSDDDKFVTTSYSSASEVKKDTIHYTFTFKKSKYYQEKN